MQKQINEIVLSPSGHSFHVEPGETVLEAALRSGYAVNYHCANGTCGDCRAEILEGKIAEHLPFDYVFKGEERQRPMILMCRSRPATDLVIEVREANSVEDIPQQQIETTVIHRNLLRDDVIELHLRTPRSRTLRFLAGQQATLQIDGVEPASRSIASCPCNGRDLTFHFFKNDNDPFTQYVFEQLKPRDSIRLEGPFGDFVLSPPYGSKIVFIAYESGFAPIKSLIEYVLSLEIDTPIELLWLAQDSVGHYLENQCRAWQDVITNFHFDLIEAPCLSENRAPLQCLESLLSPRFREMDNADVYIAAPGAVSDAVQQMLDGNYQVPGRIVSLSTF